MRKMSEHVAHRLERSKLREFFDGVIQPRLEWEGASKSHIERHAAAVEYVERFSKSPLSPDEIDEQLILNFDAWLWRQGISDGRRRDVVESLRRIVAVYTPDRDKVRTNRRQRRRLPDPATGSVRRFFEETYITHRLAGRSARYVDDCRMVLYRLHEHFERDIEVAEQSDALASAHVTWLADRGVTTTTINNHLAVWFAIWRHAQKLGLVDKGPTLRKLPKIHNAPDAWSATEMAAILDHCDAARDKPIAGHAAGDWWRALIYTVWYTGVRRRALMAIRRDDVDLHSGWIRVRGDAMKNRRGKPFRLGPDCLALSAQFGIRRASCCSTSRTTAARSTSSSDGSSRRPAYLAAIRTSAVCTRFGAARPPRSRRRKASAPHKRFSGIARWP